MHFGCSRILIQYFQKYVSISDSDLVLLVLIYRKILYVHIFLGNIKLLFSENRKFFEKLFEIVNL